MPPVSCSIYPSARHGSFDENAALAAILGDHPRLSFDAGTKYAYSNIGYWLLGKVVERASGETFQAYVSEHILRPLAIAPQELGYVEGIGTVVMTNAKGFDGRRLLDTIDASFFRSRQVQP